MHSKISFFTVWFSFLSFLFLHSSLILADESPTIEISGPSSVAVGENIQLEATTTGFGDEDYMWYLSFWAGDEMPFQVGSSGKITGLAIGKGQITVFGLASQATKTFDFYTNSGKEITLFLDMHSVHANGNSLQVEVDCDVKGQPSNGTELLAGLDLEGTFYFLPNFTTQVQTFTLNPKAGIHELIQFPVNAVPYDVTFYAATMNASHADLTSNIASKVFMGKEINQ